MAIYNYYASVQSAHGSFPLYHELLSSLEQIYLLKGSPGTGKSSFMRKIGLALMEFDLDLEYYHCPLDTKSIDALLIPSLKIGFVDSNPPHPVPLNNLQNKTIVLNFNEYLDFSKLQIEKQELDQLVKESDDHLKNAQNSFYEANQYRLKLTEILKNNCNDELLKHVQNKLEQAILIGNLDKKGEKITRRYFGSQTSSGYNHFIENITSQFSKRFILNSIHGCFTSCLLKNIGEKVQKYGFVVEFYPCSFNPNEIDMVIIPELDICIIDGTYPHHLYPYRAQDRVIEVCNDDHLNLSVAEKERVDGFELNYKTLTVKGINYLSEAKRKLDRCERFYRHCMNFDSLSQMRKTIIADIYRNKLKIYEPLDK